MAMATGIGATTPGFLEMSRGYSAQALQAAGMQRPNSKTTYTGRDKTAGGAVMSGIGAAGAGASIASMTGFGSMSAASALIEGGTAGMAGGAPGVVAGAGLGFLVGLGSYLFS